MSRSHTYEKGCPEVALTESQTRKLERIWFIYGNNGPRHMPYRHNHYFIQRFLDAGQDQRSKYHDVSQECLDAVDKILSEP